MKTYSYTILVKNSPERYLHQESTLQKSVFKESKYALISKQCYSNGTEKIDFIYYSDDIDLLMILNEKSVSWYDYVNGKCKSIQGYIRDLYVAH